MGWGEDPKGTSSQAAMRAAEALAAAVRRWELSRSMRDEEAMIEARKRLSTALSRVT